MLSRRFVAIARFVARTLPVLALVAALVPWMFVPSTQAQPSDPAARLQIVAKSVYVLDDRSLFGGGDMKLTAALAKCLANVPNPSCISRVSAGQDFSASSGDTVTLNRVIPRNGDQMDARAVSEEAGIAVYPGDYYGLGFDIEGQQSDLVGWAECTVYVFTVTVVDDCGGDRLGVVLNRFDESNGWGIGTYTVPSSRTDCSRVVSLFPPETEVGACFTLTYEIRLTPLPDLHPTEIRVLQNPGGGESVCLGVENLGPVDAGPFEMVFRIDDQDVPNGTVAAGGLPAGQSGLLCTPAALPRGQHTLSSTVDEARLITEQRETNNRFERKVIRVVGVLPPLEPAGTVQPPQAPPDLVVQTLNIAHNSDGSGKCQGDTTNYLFAQVKNVGQGPAGEFAVRLEVRGDLKQETVYVQGLGPGEAVDVRMATDDLNAGPQPVKVIADGDNQLAESDESNNALEITATCD